MKLNVYDAHDRYLHLQKKLAENISQGADDCLKKNILSLDIQDRSPYVYLWAHPRTTDDYLGKRLLWQPRLTKPTPQTNSYLLRAKSKTDIVEICWFLPPREMWNSYRKGNITESEVVNWSIDQFSNSRQKLSHPHPEDFEDEKIRFIYLQIAANTEHNLKKLCKELLKDD
jgi:hypothetical protein